MASVTKTLSAALVTTALLATPAFAQHRERGQGQSEGRANGRSEGRTNRQSEGQAVERAQPRAQAPRAEAPRAEAPRAVAPRVEPRRDVAPRVDGRRDIAPRVDGRRDVAPRASFGQAVPRREVIVPRTYGYAPRYSPRYAPHYSGRYYAPFWTGRTYYRPYAFRPRFSIGLNIFAGYPVAYTYPYPYAYSVGRPPASYYGGVVLEIEPIGAAVYVDGAYAGVVADFDGSRQPLTLAGGTHRIEIVEQGLAPLVFDVVVQPGQVIPYRGDLRPY
jgi:hypothetical protein